MYDYKETWKVKIAAILTEFLNETMPDEKIPPTQVIAEIPPDPEMGDLAFPMFSFAKLLQKGSSQIAQMAAEKLPGSKAVGPYLNVRIDRREVAVGILREFSAVNNTVPFGRPNTLRGSRIMVEYSSPNTNKPLHLGHLRNDVLGESISRIFEACGAEVRRVCIINNRGIHICKSMVAYKHYGGEKTPESENIKSDHFVGNWYVAFAKKFKAEVDELEKSGVPEKEAEDQAPIMREARELLRKWEAGDPETNAIWKMMNDWAVSGWLETYKRTGVRFDQYYYESETYLLGKDEILKGIENGIFYREVDGSVQIDLTAEKLDKKVLLRRDGTSLYITQDIGTAIYRHKDWPFDRLIYVVGSEQIYHFKVLFLLLEKLGFPWARNLYHLSYGMVYLPEGKMKSREGTIVDADDLINSLKEMAYNQIMEKEREEVVGDTEAVAEKIAIGALHYLLLQSHSKDMHFDPNDSLSFTGNTGPYLQYMGARVSSLLRKVTENFGNDSRADTESHFELLINDAEWDLVKIIGAYSETLAAAAANVDPSLVTAYLYDLAKAFSRFYNTCPVLSADEPDITVSRIALCRVVLAVLKDALDMVCISFLEVM